MNASEPARFASTYLRAEHLSPRSRLFPNNSLSTSNPQIASKLRRSSPFLSDHRRRNPDRFHSWNPLLPKYARSYQPSFFLACSRPTIRIAAVVEGPEPE